ncbi:MAG: DinB family protein [Candidatus Hinthialibacter antarcticus]|nr:DinB family protein [Candidatus Hinthialibacter antarcticus]
MNANELFIQHSRWRLKDDYWPRIQKCAALLSEDEMWRRPNDASNSVGNILLHLCGNVRQWVVHGLGGETDNRKRQSEFDERSPIPKAELLAKMEQTLNEVDAVLAQLDPNTLTEPRKIQGYDETTLTAVYHIVEHFSYHLGQIAYITKAYQAVDLGFFNIGDDGYSTNS